MAEGIATLPGLSPAAPAAVVDRRNLPDAARAWCLAASFACQLPLLLQLPGWLGLAIGALAVAVAAISWKRRLPSLLRALLALAAVGLVLAGSGFSFGRDTGCALLAAMLAIKPVELFTWRDARSLLGFALFAPFATFLLDQGPLSLLLGLWVIARDRRRASRNGAERVVIGIYIGAGVVCALRLLEQWQQPQSGPAFDAGITPAQQLALGYFLLAPVFATFAFVLAQLERQQRLLEGLAAADPLTGLDNRRAFFERVVRQLGIGPRDERLAALLMIDVDGFKPVNDRHGHAVGDRVLGVVAGALRAALQGRDIAGRFGGDEFCMLLVDVSPGEAGQRAERLRAAVAAQPVRVDGIEVPVTLSIGIAHARPGGDVDLDALLATADRRLYLAKRAGRDRVIDRDVEVELPVRA
mgnify:CR=1 FL=1